MPEPVDVTNLQGLVVSGYDRWPYSRYRLLRIVDPAAARRWLADEIAVLTYGTDDIAAAKAAPTCRNLAFTYAGLAELGLAAAPAAFPKAFRDGMGSPVRARALGDLPGSRSDPAHWRWGGPDAPVHILQMLFARTDAEATALCRAESQATRDFLHEVVDTTEVCLRHDVNEHFGFADGKSQPAYVGVHARDGGPMHRLQPGELLLGHRDGVGRRSDSPEIDPVADPDGLLDRSPAGNADFGRDGAYLVVRQMRQDVAGFEAMLDELSERSGLDRELLAAKIVGRWRNGCPLLPGATTAGLDDRNDFLFDSHGDALGHGCPFGSHIRRANPRDSAFRPWDDARGGEEEIKASNRRRLLRRGRLFGPAFADAPDAERGLMFVALCADIERQFEFVQRSWLLNPHFAGLTGDTDPLLDDGNGRHTLQEAPFARRIDGVRAHVWTEAGGYFLLPSRKALRFLARPSLAPAAGIASEAARTPAPVG